MDVARALAARSIARASADRVHPRQPVSCAHVRARTTPTREPPSVAPARLLRPAPSGLVTNRARRAPVVEPRREIAIAMDKYRRVKLLGKGSFGSAVLVTLAKDPSKKFVVVRSRRARPRVASALGQRPGKRQRRRKRRGPRSIARRTPTNPNPQSRSPSDPPSPSTSQKEVDISKMPKEERDASLQEAKLLSARITPTSSPVSSPSPSAVSCASCRTTAPAATCTSESRRREVLPSPRPRSWTGSPRYFSG